MQKKSQKIAWTLLFSGSIAFGGLAGCQGNAAGIHPVVAKSEEPVGETDSRINPSWMYDILVAEMLAGRGDFVNAYHVMMRVAKQSQDVALAERAFNFAMSGYEPRGIEQSAALWRSLEPTDATPWRIGYIMALRAGNLDDALQNWDAYRARSEDSLATDLKNAATQIGHGIEADIALAFFERLHQRHQGEWSAGYVYGFVADHYQQHELAVSILEDVVSRFAVDRDVYFALINIYLEQDWYERGLDVLADYIAEHPDDWTMQERYARLEVRAQRFDAAEARYQRIVKNNPQARASQLSLALLLLDRGDFDAAIPHFHALLRQQSYQDVTNYYLGLIYQDQSQNSLARQHLDRVGEGLYFLDAQLILSQLDFDEIGLDAALQRLAALDAADPAEQLKLWRAKGSFYSQAKRWHDAAAVYRQAHAQNSELLPLIYAYALSLYNAELFTEYEAVVKQAVLNNPDEPDLLNALGYFYAEKGINLAEAKELLDRALEIAPDAFHIIDSRGWLAYQQGEFELAEKLISQAWSMQQDEEVLLHLIKVKWALRKFEEAEALWQRYHHQYADNEEVQNLLIKLRADSKKSATP
ncbi:lipopolysaccharide assembly protein LapB [Thiomicrospira sp. ALE5]|uniref:tetratricopeptide repeat protein n=1 Tax=Thiomicrospira sp. ALE5 TaxID=748650 RepID=UPI0008E3CE9D|nr:tetratricopeptide repeat protein [Thiomicrospira sp. ALE5]SFR52362.1 Flp pilus assembly protein TadD, contains TPR repeats [Thiomicrospira sp. ALE5]